MNETEYRRYRQALEAAMEEAVEQVRLGYRAQIRALDLVWLASPENPAPVFALIEGRRAPAPLALAAPPLPGPEPEPPAKKRWPPGKLRQEVLDLLPGLPEEFTREDLERRLSGEPERSSLQRVLRDLAWEDEIEIVERGYQHTLSRYRCKSARAAEPAAG